MKGLLPGGGRGQRYITGAGRQGRVGLVVPLQKGAGAIDADGEADGLGLGPVRPGDGRWASRAVPGAGR